MKLTDKIKNFLNSKKSEEKQFKPTEHAAPKIPPVSPKPAKAEVHKPQEIELPDSFLAESADEEKDKTIKLLEQNIENIFCKLHR